MRKEEYIESRIGRKMPFVVPDGYFESLASQIEAKLPEYPAVPKVQRLSLWDRVRPYVYMAAMFAGIWCMMKMFYMMSNPTLSLDSAPEQIAMVMASPEEYDLEVRQSNIGDYALEEEVAEQYSSFDELQQDLGITLTEDYR